MYSIRQRFLAEVLGTAALVLVGPGSVIATLTLAGKAVPAVTQAYLQAALAEAAGTGLLLFAILGIVDGRSPQQLAGLVIGGAVVGIILIFGPVTGASLNPARAFGPELVQAIAGGTTFWTQYIPVYLIPGLIGAAAAAFAYDYLANPRLVEQPIEEAVSHEEAPARAAAAH